jgi:hypothetical protein
MMIVDDVVVTDGHRLPEGFRVLSNQITKQNLMKY